MDDRRRRRARRATRGSVLVAIAAMVVAGTGNALAATTNPNPSVMEQQHSDLSERAATEGMVLLQNHDQALPVAKGGDVALFGVGSYLTVKGGTGSGAVNNRSNVNVHDGLTNAGFTITTGASYWNAMTAAADAASSGGGGGGPFGGGLNYANIEVALTEQTAAPSVPTDTAIYVIPRNSGEGADRSSAAGDYQLGETEQANIELLGTLYKNVIVILNTGGIMDTSFFDAINASEKDPSGGQALDALLLMSQAGQRGGDALAQILDGEVTPSGKLTDTWASKYSYYPASATFGNNDSDSTQEDYAEGIYVGYRYFDSFYKTIDESDPASVVDYPFGYGLSYTDFAITPLSVTADMTSVTVQARVSNIGDTYSGKEVVETYFSAPQTGLDKPYQQLAGYAKTDVLAPGKSQTVTIRFNTTDMASYDEAQAAYVMDAGDYVIRVGDSSRNTHVAATVHLGATTVTEQLHNELDDDGSLDVLTSDPANFYTYAGESNEIAAAPKVTLNTTGFTAPNNASANEQNIDDNDPDSIYYQIDGTPISSTTAYIADDQESNWEDTGEPYEAKLGETTEPITVDRSKTLFDVAKGDYPLQNFVAGLSVTQLGNLVEGSKAAGSTLTAVGAAGYTTPLYEDLGIPGMTLSDGPAGLRLTQEFTSGSTTLYQWQTAWPIGTMLAQTWNRDLVTEVGNAIGQEMLEAGVTLWLAPGMDIHRDPLNGRNFEYYSEDPLVTGLSAAAITEGVQSNPGVGVTVKHYATNNQETSRNSENNTIDERALREIYLRGFEIAVKTAQPMAVMTSYNKINGTWASMNYDLIEDVLRGEWGFKGLVMTDWGGTHGATQTMYAGNDLIEPGGNPSDVINATLKVAPTIDTNGLASYNASTSRGQLRYTWAFNGLVPSADGAETITTTVDADMATGQPLSGSTSNGTFTPNQPYASVQDAYDDVTDTLLSKLSSSQQDAITVTPTYETPGDDTTPMVSYTVTIKGDYAVTMRLGDLQRSAVNILNIVMQSAPFQELASIQAVSGIAAHPYTAQFTDREHVLDASLGPVVTTPSDNSGSGGSSGSDNSSGSSGSSGSNSSGSTTGTPSRIAGTNRNATAADIAAEYLAANGDAGNAVVLANGTGGKLGIDALAANYLAGAENAPILLTDSSSSLPKETQNALKALFQGSTGTITIYVMGKADSVSQAAQAQAVAIVQGVVSGSATKVNAVRVAGDNRYETSANTATTVGASHVASFDIGKGNLKTAFLASGTVNADALAAGAISAGNSIPMLLTDGTSVNGAVATAIKNLGIKQIVALGGSDRVSDAELSALVKNDGVLNTIRIAGTGTYGRYDTAALLNNFAFGSGSTNLGLGQARVATPAAAYLANGAAGFPDALAVGPLAGFVNASVYTVPQTVLPSLVKQSLQSLASQLSGVQALGSTDRVADSVLAEAQAAIG